MYQISLINAVRSWERKLEIDAEKKQYLQKRTDFQAMKHSTPSLKELISKVFLLPKTEKREIYLDQCCSQVSCQKNHAA